MFMPSNEAIAQTMRERGVDAAELAKRTGIAQERVEELCGQGDLPSIPKVREARAIAQVLGDGISCRATNDWWAHDLVVWLEGERMDLGGGEYCYLAHIPSGDCRMAFFAVDEYEYRYEYEDIARLFEAYGWLGIVVERMSITEALEIAREQLNPVLVFPDGSTFVTPDVQTWVDLARGTFGMEGGNLWDSMGKGLPDFCRGFEFPAPGGATLVARLTRVHGDARAEVVLRRPGQMGEQRLLEVCLPDKRVDSWVRAGSEEAVWCTLGAMGAWQASELWWEKPGELSLNNLASIALGDGYYLVAMAAKDGDETVAVGVDAVADNRYGEGESKLTLGWVTVGKEGAVVHANGGRPGAARTAWLDAQGNDAKVLKYISSYESGGVRAEMSEADGPWNPRGLTMTELDLTDLKTGRSAHIANAHVRGESALRLYVDGGYAMSRIDAEFDFLW